MMKFRIQQTGSPIRRHYSQRQTLIGLGLNRIGRIAEVPDTPATWGMIKKVRHLIGFPDEHLYEQHRLIRPGPVIEGADLDLVRRLVFEPRCIRVERINEAQMEGEKSPDFRLFKDGQLQGFCEVKSPRDHWDFEFPKDLKPGEIREETRRDPAAPNLGLHIVKAAKQFDSVNPDHSAPNILVVVNHAMGRNPLDLRFALEGLKVPGGGRGLFIFDEKKQGDKDQEVPDEKQKEVWEAAKSIDLYLWVDPQKKTWVYRFPLGAKRLAEACALVGIEPPSPNARDQGG